MLNTIDYLFIQYFLRPSLFLLGALLTFFSPQGAAELTIAVVGKTKNDSFYQQSFHGCQYFANLHPALNCIYTGPDDFQDVRAQVIIVQELLEKNIDALLISTTDSDFLVKGALQEFSARNIPVITFNSDLLPQHHQYRLAYVGTNNFDFGQALGQYAKRFKHSEKQSICLQSGHKTTPNLNSRLAGVRFALAGENTPRLTGQNGWYEHPRSPLYSLGKRADSVHQLDTMLKKTPPPIFLAVAGFAQFSPDYVSTVYPYKKQIEQHKIVIISADTEDTQLDVLKQGLSVANIGQKPFEMGRLGAELLYNYLINKQRPEKSSYYLGYHYCTPENVEYCTINR